jgi:endonuclease YncB( thermonuclease family)
MPGYRTGSSRLYLSRTECLFVTFRSTTQSQLSMHRSLLLLLSSTASFSYLPVPKPAIIQRTFLLSFLASTLLLSISAADMNIPSTRFETAAQIPDRYIKEKMSLSGTVHSVTDGDTFRMRHVPSISFGGHTSFDGKVADHTIVVLHSQTAPLEVPYISPSVQVRLAAVDCPETAKRGDPGQPFAEEAKSFVEKQLKYGGHIRVKCLSRDQYGRLVGRVLN